MLNTATLGSDQPKADEPTTSSSKVVPARICDPPLILKASPKTVTKAPKPPEAAKKPTKKHVCAPNPLSRVQLPPTLSLTRTQDRGVDPMTNTSSVIDLTVTAGSQTSSLDDDTYATARVWTTGTDSIFLPASEGVLAGNPCASSTRKKEQLNGDLSLQGTKGSRDNSPAASDEGEVISSEQLQFAAAISKAMYLELAPLLAGRDLSQGRPSVFRGSKEVSIDGWNLVMRRYLQRTQRTQTKATPDDKVGVSSVTWKVKLATTSSTRQSPKPPSLPHPP